MFESECNENKTPVQELEKGRTPKQNDWTASQDACHDDSNSNLIGDGKIKGAVYFS